MAIELVLLTWVMVLALVQIFLPAYFRNKETGQEYNVGPRDDPGPPVGVITGRLQRAQRNLYETLPLFIGAILVAHLTAKTGTLTLIGAWMYLIARVVYVPLYAFGIPKIRTFAWLIATVGLCMILASLLLPTN